MDANRDLQSVTKGGFKGYYILSLIILTIGVAGALITGRNLEESNIQNYHSFLRNECDLKELAFNKIKTVIQLTMYNPEKVTAQQTYEIERNLKFIANIEGVSAAYIMDTTGECHFSSDSTFLGKNYGFRPYFKNAIRHGDAVYCAYGVTSGKTGIYYAKALYEEDIITAVTVIKFSPMFFSMNSPTILLPNKEGNPSAKTTLLLSSGIFINTINSSIHHLEFIPDSLREELERTRQFPYEQIVNAGFDDGTLEELKVSGFVKREQGKRSWVLFFHPILGNSVGVLSMVDQNAFNKAHFSSVRVFYFLILSLILIILLFVLSTIVLLKRQKRLQELAFQYQKRVDEILEVATDNE